MKALLGRGINVITSSVDMKLLENLDVTSHGNAAKIFRLELNVTSPDSIASALAEVMEITGGKLHFLFSMLHRIFLRITFRANIRSPTYR
jgi:hypothetical protein